MIPSSLFTASLSDELTTSESLNKNNPLDADVGDGFLLSDRNEEFSKSNDFEDIEDQFSRGPKLGLEFISIDDAYNYYTNYAGKLDFNVRKFHHTKNKNGIVTKVSFCCSRQGVRQLDKRSQGATFQKPITRVSCMAEISYSLQKNGKFKIVSCYMVHNHELVSSPIKHMLKFNRSISQAQKSRTDDVDKSGISIKAAMELLSREVGGREHVGFTDKDYQNYIHSRRKLAMGKFAQLLNGLRPCSPVKKSAY